MAKQLANWHNLVRRLLALARQLVPYFTVGNDRHTCRSMLIAFVIASARWLTLQQLVGSDSKVVRHSRRKRKKDRSKNGQLLYCQTHRHMHSKHTIAPTAILLHVQYGHFTGKSISSTAKQKTPKFAPSNHNRCESRQVSRNSKQHTRTDDSIESCLWLTLPFQHSAAAATAAVRAR